jgi:hypothetical protein
MTSVIDQLQLLKRRHEELRNRIQRRQREFAGTFLSNNRKELFFCFVKVFGRDLLQ